MKKIILAIVITLLSLYIPAQNVGIIPSPQKIKIHSGNFTWSQETALFYDPNDEAATSVATMLNEEIHQIFGVKMSVVEKPKKNLRYIDLRIVDSIAAPDNQEQAYEIVISDHKISVKASSRQGLFYGSQSLKQLLRYHWLKQRQSQRIDIPCAVITDWPALRYRGWMDDISRGPIVSTSYLKKIIPIMAEYKLNFFNLYTEHTFKLQSHPDIAPQDGLTAEEIKELEAFCTPYHIEIFGNQQCFAHAEETLKIPFYDNIADTKDNYHPGIDDTYKFLDEIFSEVAPAYASPLFNIDCDETQGLGTGKARHYVDSIGSTTAYYQHINRVYHLLQKYNKKVMMWGDIAAEHPEIIDKLPSDLIIIAWNYDALDSFDRCIKPFKASGFDFLIAPGVSMWSTTFPDMEIYTKNIANFVRDGYLNGSLGMMNTAWDDSGESLINSAIHALVWGAEMSWNPILETEKNEADRLRKKRLSTFDQYFSAHFFGNADENLVKGLWQLDSIKHLKGNNITSFGALHEPMLPFYPSMTNDEARHCYPIILDAALKEAENLKILQDKASTNAEIFDNAIYAANRMAWCALRNMVRIHLYDTFLDTNDDNIAVAKDMITDLVTRLHSLKYDYVKIWEQECRSYWRDVNLERYDKIAQELLTLDLQTFITSKASPNGKIAVELRTLFNDREIHYSIDGAEPKLSSESYQKPFEIDHSCVVKTACFGDYGQRYYNEKYILSHKGIGKLRRLNSPAGNYRPEYSGGGDHALVDGVVGGGHYTDGTWQGFYGVDADIELDFGKNEKIDKIEVGFLAYPYDWILQPKTMRLLTSKDGINYEIFGTYDITESEADRKIHIYNKTLKPKSLNCRYLRIVVENPGKIPEGLPGAGFDSWIFMDEIIIK